MPAARQLILRADDAGVCLSINLAILECCDWGLVRNVSLLVPGPEFGDAARCWVGRHDLCLGLHVTLNCEWDQVRWGPVLPRTQVPSLVDEFGHFLRQPQDLYDRSADLGQMIAEVEAQLALARRCGLKISYLDEHMGVGWLPGLGKALAALAQREGLVYAEPLSALPPVAGVHADRVQQLIAQLQAAPAGTYVIVTHPGFDNADLQRCGADVARQRDADRRLCQEARLRDACREFQFTLSRYSDLRPA